MSLSIALTSTYAWPEVRRGGERYLHELAAALVARGHEVAVVATAARPGKDRQLGVPIQLVRRRTWMSPRLGRHAAQVWFGLDALRQFAGRRLDVWHSLTLGDAAAATLRRPGACRSVYTMLGQPTALAGASRLVQRLHDRIVDRTDAYVCLSRAAQRDLISTHGRQGLVVGGGVDLDRFMPAELRHERPTVLFASDVGQRWKNADLLLEACARLLSQYPDLQLWFVGPGDVTRLAAEHASVANHITLSRMVPPDELAHRYARAWVTALPSRGEAFGLAALESLAAGTPAVALAGEGPEDFLDASTGALCEASTEGLASALAHALELSRADDTAERCRERARKHDWQTSVAPRLEAIYEGRVEEQRRT